MGNFTVISEFLTLQNWLGGLCMLSDFPFLGMKNNYRTIMLWDIWFFTCFKDMTKVPQKKNASNIQKNTILGTLQTKKERQVFSNWDDAPWYNKFKSESHPSLYDIVWSWFCHWCFNPNLWCLNDILCHAKSRKFKIRSIRCLPIRHTSGSPLLRIAICSKRFAARTSCWCRVPALTPLLSQGLSAYP